jgi:hypothetical protein
MVSGVRMAVSGGVVEVSVSPQWLAGLPPSAFPVVIDPTFFGGTQAATRLYSVSSGNYSIDEMLNGLDSVGHTWRSTAYIPAPALPALNPGERPWALLTAEFGATCTPCGLYGLNVYGLSTSATGFPTYNGIPLGTLLYSAPSDHQDTFTVRGCQPRRS